MFASRAHVVVYGLLLQWGGGPGLTEMHGEEEGTVVNFAAAEFHVPESSGGFFKLTRTGELAGRTIGRVEAAFAEEIWFEPAFSFETGQTEVEVEVKTRDDILPERDLIVRAEVIVTSGGAAGARSGADLRLVDDDGRPGNILPTPGAWELAWSWPDIRDILRLQDGRILVAGDGVGASRLTSFTAEGQLQAVPYPIEPVFVLGQQSSGKILLGGELRLMAQCVGRLNEDGTVDNSFARRAGWTGHGVYALVIQPDDRILIGGLISVGQNPLNGIARLLPDGDLDTSWNGAPATFYNVRNLVLQPDGKVILLSQSTSLGQDFSGARLLANGKVDFSFNPIRKGLSVSSPTARVSCLALQGDGKVLVSQTIPGVRTELARLQTNGVVDTAFSLGEQPDGAVTEMMALPDGTILVAGAFSRIGGVRRNGLARLKADGSVDLGFDPGTGAAIVDSYPEPKITDFILLPNGDILAGGNMGTFNGIPVKVLARIKQRSEMRFINSYSGRELNTTLIAYPGQRVVLEESTDLENWSQARTLELENYAVPLTVPKVTQNSFLRARAE